MQDPTPSFLKSLNLAQLQAVKHAPHIPIQILAGPGSGKTKVLTSRIAYLILVHFISPSSICAVTFTNKAANEMRERLTKLIGKKCTSEVKMGTFHALCTLFLRKHGKLVGLKENFTICDMDESKKIISTLLKTYKGFLEDKDLSVKEGFVLSMISKAKAKGNSAAEFLGHLNSRGQDTAKSKEVDYLIAEIYEKYENTLRQYNSLDFDDLLLFGVKLFTKHTKTVAWCKHVLVDEFQDTNITQYELMEALAINRCVTVVGDPDQSIYGWRSAEVENLSKMHRDFPGTEQIFLEQNYRSTAAILNTSLAIVAQDKTRIRKSLHTSHPLGMTPVLRSFPTENAEATFLAVEIKRVMAHMGGVLHWGDFVVLLRFNALSRAIESALQREGIPSRVLGGHKFFERLEIKDILAYLQIIDNPNFNPALIRAVNVPSRGIGEKTLLEISLRSEKTKVSQLDIIEGICDCRLPDIKPAVKRKLTPFVKIIQTLRLLAEKGASPADLIHRVVELIDYESHLRKTQPDWESRWENVQELITFASEVEADISGANEEHAVIEDFNTDTPKKDTPLRLFLQASMLSSEGDGQNEQDAKEKVTISTCHAAKGLEWPVVMVPAVEQGTFPFHRTDDVEEERRLLYVACTRAQSMLYLSYVTKRKVAGETKTKELSEFISVVNKQDQTLFTKLKPEFQAADRVVVSNVLDRPLPNELEVSRRVAEFEKTTRYHDLDTEGDACIIHRSVTDGTTVNHTPSFTLSSELVPSNNPNPVNWRRPISHTSPGLLSHSITNIPLNESVSSAPSINKFGTISGLPTSSSNNLSAHAVSSPAMVSPPQTTLPTDMNSQGLKRRLGMGRGTVGYSNKKFKPPM